MNKNLKEKGDEGEDLVCQYYQDRGHVLVRRKYTIQGGELDLVFQKDDFLTFVEVKVIDYIDDVQDYLTPRKLGHVRHTIEYYLCDYPTEKQYSLDVVFVKDNSIVEVYENVTNT